MGQDQATIMELKSAIAQQRKQIEALTATVEKGSAQITLGEGVKSLVTQQQRCLSCARGRRSTGK